MTQALTLYLLNILLVSIETATIALLADGFFPRRKSRTFYIGSFLILLVICNLNILFLEAYTLSRNIIFIAVCTIWVCMNYRATVPKAGTLSILLDVSLVLIDALLFMLVGLKPDFLELVMSEPYSYYMLVYIIKLLEVFLIVLVRNWAKRRFHAQAATRADWLQVVFFPFAALVTSLILVTAFYAEPALAPQLLVCVLLLLATVFASVLILDRMERQQVALLDNVVLKQNLKLETDHILAMQEAYAAQRKQTHDFENQLAVLQSLAKRNAPQEEFAAYLDGILAIRFPAVSYVNTHRLVVDIIVSQKTALAKGKDILFTQKLDDLTGFALPDDALVVVLTNLIDNAIEACEKVPRPEDRKLLLKMQVAPEASFLYIENTTASSVAIRDNQIATTKDQPIAHGYGLKNVTSMLERHSAVYAMEYREESRSFCFSARIPTHP